MSFESTRLPLRFDDAVVKCIDVHHEVDGRDLNGAACYDFGVPRIFRVRSHDANVTFARVDGHVLGAEREIRIQLFREVDLRG